MAIIPNTHALLVKCAGPRGGSGSPLILYGKTQKKAVASGSPLMAATPEAMAGGPRSSHRSDRGTSWSS